MKSIPLTQGRFALVDDDDFEYLNQFNWYCSSGYAVRKLKTQNGKRLSMKMHREILKTPDNMTTDHINGNKLDNRKENLRICTQAENTRNRPADRNSTSGYKGVSWNNRLSKWICQIKANGKSRHLGVFSNPEEAAKVYDAEAIVLFGSFAKLNFPKEVK